MSLTEINRRYEEIMQADVSDYYKTVKLAELMTEMEAEYRIPMLKKPEWEEKNRKVISLYRKISRSRKDD
ncbi:hypothetical protein [Aerococcus viridans]|uniref:hypothetical protein n=1 Tax=Aerococcus viridans TaxID=1377 RepID=UPI002DBF50BA|nr:hypothetical protein [Aerococcus viridans]MEC1387351.1 hypothetical protein [Aerococcus viridans]